MKRLLGVAVLILGALVGTQAQVQIVSIEPGKRADSVDRVTQENIKHAIQDHFSDWKLEAVREERESSSSIMGWTSGGQKIVVYVSYLLSEDATKQIRFNLTTIQMPIYKPLADVGDEAYLIKTEGPIMFRKANVIITVCGCEGPREVVKQFAGRIADAVTAG